VSHTPTISIIAHVYYPGSWILIKEKCKDILVNCENLLISSCYDDVIQEIDEEKAVIFKVSNLGKDIGGKLISLKYYLEFCNKTDLVVFLHDKVSPQTLNSAYWFDKLYEVFAPAKFRKVLSVLRGEKNVGMVGSGKFLNNEYIKTVGRFDTNNNEILLSLMKQYYIQPRVYDFIAGSIFIVRSVLYENFFKVVDPLEVRATLEPGNVLDISNGTYTHSWERLLSFIVSSQNYKIRGI
jgi:hypothetical protein